MTSPIVSRYRFHFCIQGLIDGAPAPGAKRKLGFMGYAAPSPCGRTRPVKGPARPAGFQPVLQTCFARQGCPAAEAPSRAGEWLEAYLPLVSAACSRSRNGVCASFNLRRASSSEKKQASSTSKKFCIFPERGGHSISNMFERHWKLSGKSPSNAQA